MLLAHKNEKMWDSKAEVFAMQMSKRQYSDYANSLSPRSPAGKNVALAFAVGGAICALGQLIMNGFLALGFGQEDAGMLTASGLITLSVLATGFSVYDDLAKRAGAGTLVPITGFANAIASPAIEFRTEGFITGTAVKMFSIAGPVIVCGLSAGVLYGLVYALCRVLAL